MDSDVYVDVHTTEYLNFVQVEDNDRKTEVWKVRSRSSGALLGTVKWYGAWRQYCFFPEPNTIFNRGCLEDINSHMKARMEARR